jgi:secretory lipase
MSFRSRGSSLAVLAVALAVVLGTAGAASALEPPPGNAFYTPPSPLPPGGSGEVIWYRTTASSIAAEANATAYEVLYRSRNVAGAAFAVSGTVLVPNAAWSGSGTRPIAAYAPGTQGWGDQCAPSREMDVGTFDEGFAVTNLLARGWAVVVSDYPGLGTPGDETYAVGISEGYAVLDAIRAATRVAPAGLTAGTKVAIEGYSQGGGAAGWAVQQQASYAPDVNLVGVANGGTPANLPGVKANLDGGPFFAFVAGTAIGFRAAYPELNLNQYLTFYGRLAISTLDGLCQGEALPLYAFHHLTEYTVNGIDPTTGVPAVAAAIRSNNLGTIRPAAPVYQYHGVIDQVIPYAQEQTLHDQWCGLGATSKLVGYAGEHILTQVIAQTDVVNWIADRFAGLAPPSNC